MKNGLAEPLSKWLTESAYNLGMFEGRRIVVVGIVGKASSDCSKADPINSLLERPVFIQRIPVEDSTASIEAYYASELSAVFLHLSGYGDLCSLEHFVRNSGDDRKGFFEHLSQLEIDYARCLTFLLLCSHLLIYMEPGCRFDQSCCRDLKRANELRRFCQKEIRTKLSAVAGFPQDWSSEGRLAQPRCLFAFHRHLLRGDLNSSRKRELKSKLVEKLEQQIYRCMQIYGLIGTGDKDGPCSLPKSVEQFVYLFSAAESCHDVIRSSLLMLLERGNNKEENDGTEKKEKEERSSDFGEFLRSHINFVRQDEEKRKYLYEVPKLKWLLIGGQIVYNQLFQTRIFSDEKIYKLSSLELQFSKSMESAYIGQAKAVYQNSGKDGRDFEKRKSQVFTKAEHEAKCSIIQLARAVEHLECIYHGTRLEKAKEILKQECESLWATQKACEFISLTGNECILPIHHSLSDLEVPVSKRVAHSSGARFLSTCNCGHSQALRNDPFSLREANYDFYMQFACCKNIGEYEFEIFKYDDIKEGSLDVESSPDKSQKSTTPEHSFSEFSATSMGENDLKMLLDRDNPLEGDEVHHESMQSPFKTEGTDIDEVEKELVEKKVSVLSETEKCGEEQTPEELENNDEEDDEEYVRAEEPEQPFPGMRRHRAHMDDYESWWQEDEEGIPEVEGQVSYLDDDDVQLREPEVDNSDTLDTFAMNFEEELVKLRKLCKGQFLECVPNTESPSRKPLFPSWSLVCLGASSLYSHKAGLRDMPNFKSGTQFLLPVDIFVTIDPEKWDVDMKEIMGDSYGMRSKRPIKVSKSNREKVKLFIGFEYECPRGHRFMIQDVRPSIRGKMAPNSKESGSALIRSDLPLWTKCTCRRRPQVSAQLMRLHVVTPKAPVTVILNPRVQPTSKEPIYHTGEAPIHLEWARYYILRFPYVYAGPHGTVQRPNEGTALGKLFANCVEVHYIPMH
uniref:Nonsense-mediated mRNA decay factor SMG8 n=1 Tax=Setaria digitata TaxID=48799 RepID=A0A915Q423_9BILA